MRFFNIIFVKTFCEFMPIEVFDKSRSCVMIYCGRKISVLKAFLDRNGILD